LGEKPPEMKKINFRAWTIPWALLLLCLVSFGLLIPWLGFFWDDWPIVLMTRLQGAAGFWKFYQFDRPLSSWVYILSTPLLGTTPFIWHLFSLLVRWLTILGMWWSLRCLWPQRTREVTWMALLFAIYPSFTEQPVSVTYSLPWICYALYFLSIGAMIQAVRKPRWYWPLTALALLASALQLFTLEYYIGLELLRPVFLWLVAGEEASTTRKRLWTTFKRWLPYLLVMAAFVIYRLFFFKLAADDPNKAVLVFQLFTHPLPVLIHLAQMALQDTINTLTSPWFQTVQVAALNFSNGFVLFTWAIAILSAVLLAIYLLRLDTGETPSSPQDHWLRQAFSLGLLATLIGPIPVWLTDRQAITGLHSDRFTLAAMFGLSILIVAFLEWLTPRRLSKAIVLSALIGLAIGMHLRNTNDYHWSWAKQTRFYWQLYWRAPSLQPGTAILSDGEIFNYVGEYSTTSALNVLYPQPPNQPKLAYWFFDIYREFGRRYTELTNGIDIGGTFRTFAFSGNSDNSLVIFYAPEEGRCLWVVNSQDADNPELSTATRGLLPISNFTRIGADPAMAGYPPTSIFGAEPPHDWCYYFQKASLAAQMGNWQQVAALGNEATKLNFSPNNPQEWLPFIEGYAHLGRWSEVDQLSRHVLRVNSDLSPRMCNLWNRLETNTAASPSRDETLAALRDKYKCTP
jgi:hypothetical protein